MFFAFSFRLLYSTNSDAERFENENNDDLTQSRRRLTVRHDLRKRENPRIQLVRSTRNNQQIEADRQGFSVARNPSIAENIDNPSLNSPQQSYFFMTGGSNTSISSLFGSNTSCSLQSIDTISSVSSSSGLRLLPNDPSQSSSTNTLHDVHSICSSLEQQMNIENSCDLEAHLQFAVPRTENDGSRIKDTFAMQLQL